MDAHGSHSLYTSPTSSGPVAFVFGNEAHGLPQDIVLARRRDGARATRGRGGVAQSRRGRDVCLFERARRRGGKGASLESLIAAAAHDIRSPLTAMKGFGYALEKRWSDMTDDQRALDAAPASCTMPIGWIRSFDLLVDAARVSGGTLEPYPDRATSPSSWRRSPDCSGAIRSIHRSPGRAISARTSSTRPG